MWGSLLLASFLREAACRGAQTPETGPIPCASPEGVAPLDGQLGVWCEYPFPLNW